jgi:hypothetical protein
MAHGFAHTLQPVEHADGGQHVGRIGALPAARFEQLALGAVHQQGVEEALLRAPRHHTTAELAQDRVVEALVRQLQAQEILPVNAAAHGVRGLAVGQVLSKL